MNLTYNERSWAIDLISKINAYAGSRRRAIKRAGGEVSLKEKNQSSLFPDVILYGDDNASRVRHGWELKLPDTNIHDEEFIRNAEIKAKRFGVNSFLLWNVTQAVLYKSEDENNFEIFHEWPSLDIHSRTDVQRLEPVWTDYLIKILEDLNNFFEEGALKSASVVEVLDDNFIVSIIDSLYGLASDSIKQKARESAALEAEIKNWWINNAPEYGEKSNKGLDFNILSKVALTNWVNRFLFAHYLKKFNNKAKAVEQINSDLELVDAENIFSEITSECNFMQIFKPEISANHIGSEVWESLCETNTFLTNLQLDTLPPELLQEVVEQTLSISRRKVAGQYSTPFNLAKLLCRISIENRSSHVIDPCCGTGTIPRAAYELKRDLGFEVSDSINRIWASDKFQFPLQLCNLSMADPEALGHVTQIFKSDVFELEEGKRIKFINPNNGIEEIRTLPKFDSILSNLPFVRFEDLAKTNPSIKSIIEQNNDFNLSGRTDLFGFIIMHLRHLLQNEGRLGLIVSNSWLGTEWGETLRETLFTEFSILYVVTSSNGRWFHNADVVTNVLVLEKKETTNETPTQFITTTTPISSWDDESIDIIALNAISTYSDLETRHSNHVIYSRNEINQVTEFLPGWSALFGNVKWLSEVTYALTKVSDYYNINRGERRGWNEMFYPSPGHNIESQYIRPVLLTARNIKSYIARATSEAFCCSKTKEELTSIGHHGALNWINRFENQRNGTGRLLPEVLARAGHQWYEMKPDTQANLVLSMNPGNRIFIAKMQPIGFVDQRLIRFTAVNDNVDNELCHALLNSIFGLFMIEASGFGRGLGALDLNPTKLNRNLYMLDPQILETQSIDRIKNAFSNIVARDVLNLPEEINNSTREEFDILVLHEFGLEEYYNSIKNSLLTIYKIRDSVN